MNFRVAKIQKTYNEEVLKLVAKNKIANAFQQVSNAFRMQPVMA